MSNSNHDRIQLAALLGFDVRNMDLLEVFLVESAVLHDAEVTKWRVAQPRERQCCVTASGLDAVEAMSKEQRSALRARIQR